MSGFKDFASGGAMSSDQNFDCFLVLQATKIVNNIFMTRAYNTKKLANFWGWGGWGAEGEQKNL